MGRDCSARRLLASVASANTVLDNVSGGQRDIFQTSLTLQKQSAIQAGEWPCYSLVPQQPWGSSNGLGSFPPQQPHDRHWKPHTTTTRTINKFEVNTVYLGNAAIRQAGTANILVDDS
ncbi:hypothetical protein CB1_001431026 [Camelus ferus]|nr:hypothetical protein CB1_001431026 [Camelus ferus]